jgi:hypothetical protein
MAHIPPPLPNDAEDVSWALSTAESLWKRGDHSDALVWLRRGAEAASDAQDDDRALALARTAAELKDWLLARARYSTTDLIEPSDDVDVSVSIPAQEELEELEEIEPDASIPPPNGPLIQEATVPLHSGAAPSHTGPIIQEASAPLPQFSFDDAMTAQPSIHEQVTREVAGVLSTSTGVTRVVPPAPETMPQYRNRGADYGPPSSERGFKAPSERELPVPTVPSERSLPAAKPPSAKLPLPRLPGLPRLPSVPSAAKSDPVRIPLPFPPPETQRDVSEPEEILHALESTKPASVRVPAPGGLDLSQYPLFAKLPEAARAELAAAASTVDLARGEEVPASALTLILEGQVTVSAAVVDATALTLGPGEVIRSHGTIESHLSIRLIAASEQARVACWLDAVVDRALAQAPAAEYELRCQGNRIQAICGATIGPLGERLDAALLNNVTQRLEAVPYNAGAVVVEAGAHPGIVLVGAGEVVADDGTVFTSGDFVFPELVLGGGKAVHNVRAAEGGAVVLAGDRSVVQELLATSPTLIEILAGM